MSDNAPIGVFDSGVGGLSILAEIRKLLPAEDIIYLADSAHCPYGIKPIEQIQARTGEVTGYLAGLGAKAVVVACNTACVAGLDQIRLDFPHFPVIGVEPAVKPAQTETRNGKIGVLATNLTLKGDRFNHLLEKYANGVQVLTRPAPGLVELVENGQLDNPETERLLRQYLEPFIAEGIDILVLGCTHYPFLKPAIRRICGPELKILDTGVAVARQTERILEQLGILAIPDKHGTEKFYTTGDPLNVEKVMRKLWLHDRVKVEKADL